MDRRTMLKRAGAAVAGAMAAMWDFGVVGSEGKRAIAGWDEKKERWVVLQIEC